MLVSGLSTSASGSGESVRRIGSAAGARAGAVVCAGRKEGYMLLLRAESRTDGGGLMGCACGVGCPVGVECVVGGSLVSPVALALPGLAALTLPGPILTHTLAPVLSPIPLSLASTSLFTPPPNVSSPDEDGWSGVCLDDAWIDLRIWIAGTRTVVRTCEIAPRISDAFRGEMGKRAHSEEKRETTRARASGGERTCASLPAALVCSLRSTSAGLRRSTTASDVLACGADNLAALDER